ncbi:hypothetical protein Vafri_1831 [Volvox africanus]|nr:hypothetical protein Vafri_1831 [Volvox africanus]
MEERNEDKLTKGDRRGLHPHASNGCGRIGACFGRLSWSSWRLRLTYCCTKGPCGNAGGTKQSPGGAAPPKRREVDADQVEATPPLMRCNGPQLPWLATAPSAAAASPAAARATVSHVPSEWVPRFTYIDTDGPRDVLLLQVPHTGVDGEAGGNGSAAGDITTVLLRDYPSLYDGSSTTPHQRSVPSPVCSPMELRQSSFPAPPLLRGSISVYGTFEHDSSHASILGTGQFRNFPLAGVGDSGVGGGAAASGDPGVNATGTTGNVPSARAGLLARSRISPTNSYSSATCTSSSRPSRWGIRQLMGVVSAGFASLRQHLGKLGEPASGNLRPEAVAELTRWTSRTDMLRAIAQVTDLQVISQNASRSVVCRGRTGGSMVFIKYTAGPGRGEGMAAPATEGLLSRVLVHPNVVRTYGWHLTQVAAEDVSGDLEAVLAAAAAADRRKRRQREQQRRPPPGPPERQLSQTNQKLKSHLPPQRSLIVLAEGPEKLKHSRKNRSLLLRSLQRKPLSCGENAVGSAGGGDGNTVGCLGGRQPWSAWCRTPEVPSKSLLYGTAAVAITLDEVLYGKPAGEDVAAAADSGHSSSKGYKSAPASILLARTVTAGSCPTAINSLYNVQGGSVSGGEAAAGRQLSVGTLTPDLGSTVVRTQLPHNGMTLQAGSGMIMTGVAPVVDCEMLAVAAAGVNNDGAAGTAAAAAAPCPIPPLTRSQAASAWREMQDMLQRLNARPGDYIARIVMEAADLGSMLTAIRQGIFSGSSASIPRLHALLLTARDITRGMAHLHRHTIIHGDLKPSNVLLRSEPTDPRGFVALVSDFGLSRIAPQGCLEGSELYGTVSFMAPEVISGYRCPASDVYSYGVLLWQMINQTPPWPRLRNVQVMMGILQGELRLSAPQETYPPLAALLERCLTHNHTTRPTFEFIEKELEIMLHDVEQSLAANIFATVASEAGGVVVPNETGGTAAATTGGSMAVSAVAGMSPVCCPSPPVAAVPSSSTTAGSAAAAVAGQPVAAGLLAAMTGASMATTAAGGRYLHPPRVWRSSMHPPQPSQHLHPKYTQHQHQHQHQHPGHQQGLVMVHRDGPSSRPVSTRALLAYTAFNPMHTATIESEGDIECNVMGSISTLNLRLEPALSITTTTTATTTVAQTADGLGDTAGGGLLEGRDDVVTASGGAVVTGDIANGVPGASASAQSGVGASRCRSAFIRQQQDATGLLSPPISSSQLAMASRMLNTREWTLALTVVASGSGSSVESHQAGNSMLLLTSLQQMYHQKQQPHCTSSSKVMPSSAGQHTSYTTTTITAAAATRMGTRHFYYCSSNGSGGMFGANTATIPAASSTGGTDTATATVLCTTARVAGAGGGDTAAADGGELLVAIKPSSLYCCRSRNSRAGKSDCAAAEGPVVMSDSVCVGGMCKSSLMAGSNACDNSGNNDNSRSSGHRARNNSGGITVEGKLSKGHSSNNNATGDNDMMNISGNGGGNGNNDDDDDTRNHGSGGIDEELDEEEAGEEMVREEEQLFGTSGVATTGSRSPNRRLLSSVITGNFAAAAAAVAAAEAAASTTAAATEGHLSSSSATFRLQCSSWYGSTTVTTTTTTNTNNNSTCTTTQNNIISSMATSTPLLLGGSPSPLPSASMGKCIPAVAAMDNISQDCGTGPAAAAVPMIVPITQA